MVSYGGYFLSYDTKVTQILPPLFQHSVMHVMYLRNPSTIVNYREINRQNREAARFIERQERSILSVLKSEFVPATNKQQFTYLFFAVISRIKDRQKCDILGGAAFKRHYYMMNIISYTLQKSRIVKEKPRPGRKLLFFHLFFCGKSCPFHAFVRENFVCKIQKSILSHFLNSSLTNKHEMYLN